MYVFGRAEFAPLNRWTPGVQVVLYVISTQAESEDEQLRNAAALFIFILHVLLCNLSHGRCKRLLSASFFHVAADLKVASVLFHLQRRTSSSLLLQAVELLQGCRTRWSFSLCVVWYWAHKSMTRAEANPDKILFICLFYPYKVFDFDLTYLTDFTNFFCL